MSDKQSQIQTKTTTAPLPPKKVSADDEYHQNSKNSTKKLKPKEVSQQTPLNVMQQAPAFGAGLSQAQIAAALAALMTPPQASATPSSTSPSSSIASTSPTSSTHASANPQLAQASIQQQLLQNLMINPAANMNTNPFYELMKNCFQMQYQNMFAAKLFENHLKSQLNLNDADVSNNCKYMNMNMPGSFVNNNRATFSDQNNSSDVDDTSEHNNNNDSNENDELNNTQSNSKNKQLLHKNPHQQNNLVNSKKSSKKSVNRN